ncbi:MAG TPA: response regulator transcription factor [Candidatus Obscuribacterales bacterium]
MAKILLVEDNAQLAEQVKAWLQYEEHIVEVATEGDDALDRLRHYHYDLIILDWMLPGMEGIEVCRRLRERGFKIPVLMLTGRSALTDTTAGLDGGADDYMTKPVVPAELSARIRALLRRAAPTESAALELGDLYIDPTKLSVRKSGMEISLQPKELRLLELFMHHPNELLATNFIIEHIWPGDCEASPNLVKSYINKLRAKFETCQRPLAIKSVYGKGYILEQID